MNPEENKPNTNGIEAYNVIGNQKRAQPETANQIPDYSSQSSFSAKVERKKNKPSEYVYLIGAIILAISSYSVYRAYIAGLFPGKAIADNNAGISIKFPASCIINTEEDTRDGAYTKGYYCKTKNQIYGLFILKGPANESPLDQRIAFNTMLKGDGNSYTELKDSVTSIKNNNEVIEFSGILHSGANAGNQKGYFIQKKNTNLFIDVTATTENTSTEVNIEKLNEFINSLVIN